MTELYAAGPHIAIFRGLRPQAQELEVEVIAHDGSIELPALGEFLLIAGQAGDAALARVTQVFPTGPIASPQGEGYLTELGRAGATLPQQVREYVLRFTMRLAMLGRLKRDSGGLQLQVGLRKFPPVGTKVHRPSEAALQFICNAGLSDTAAGDSVPVPFGHYVIGDQVEESLEVRFDINRLKRKRSFVFARAGYGKSNLIKYLISQLYRTKPEVGLLIIDPEGEYAARSERVPGLADVPGLREKMHVYSQRRQSDIGDILRGPVKIDFGRLSGEVLVTSFSPPEKHAMVWAGWIRSARPEQLRKLIDLLFRAEYKASDQEIAGILGVQARSNKDGGRDVSIGAILNNLIPAMKRLHDPQGINMAFLRDRLREGHVVILDTSILAGPDARAVSEIILTSLFYNNVRSFTAQGNDAKPIPCIAVLEEAQTILGHQNFSETSIFVRWVKEGRKYDLGSIMITQQPGAISEQILSQGDNFFVMHLLNQADLNALHAVNAHFSPDILQQLRHEPIRGNCYFWSAPDQPYVVCARVHNFDLIARREPSGQLASAVPATKPADFRQEEEDEVPWPVREAVPSAAAQPAARPGHSASPSPATLSREVVLQAIGSNPRVFLYPEQGAPNVVFSVRYLVMALNSTEDLIRETLAEMGAQFGFAKLGKADQTIAVLPETLIQIPEAKRGQRPVGVRRNGTA